MRDLLIFLIVFGLLPYVLKRPHWGIYLWSWIGYMNPHRLGWSFAFYFPFAQIIGLVTLISFFVSSKKLKFFWSPTMGWLIFFNIWMLISTLFAMYPDVAWSQWEKIIKIQLVIFLTLFALVDREKIHIFVWIIVISIGFYGFKGGIFTLTTGGGSHVLGPRGGFIAGNTEIGLALVMILPLVWYLFLHSQNKWIRYGLVLSMFLIAIGILGTQSRGAFLAISAVSAFLWLKSSRKMVIFIALLMLSPFFYMVMPQSWHDRMATIQNYEEDGSAMSRLKAWEFGYAMALDRPFTGGGYESHTVENYERYVPHQIEQGIATFHDYHSIYFEILAEHGFVGLFIFLMLFVQYWRTANKIIRTCKDTGQNKWALDLAAMLQVSFIGYAVGGAFLGLAYFDLFYHYLAILVMTLKILEDEKNDPAPTTVPATK
ncbi:putative O-glycosylation ligase, exosortase A system-associated [Nitrosomonas marina]|uniref:Probable O-glycosylation ligase, exosortase A-associated n=1 Tax=Nitrosomonas marina TaxID=917 RepID=A0A1H8BWL5_9PROT|nr:putative O-glycosylation ligase, exosortase A system-associated [Nitrosomonas marina]SEM87311.1 probable O-glycosylation ligase, exosortase A-associated [Nitrosomonas marina]